MDLLAVSVALNQISPIVPWVPAEEDRDHSSHRRHNWPESLPGDLPNRSIGAVAYQASDLHDTVQNIVNT
jgi:hypothetical protein